MMKVISFDKPTAMDEFVESLKDTGFAVVNPGIDVQPLLDDAYEEWAEFFSNHENKMEYLFNPSTQSGYFPFGSEKAKDSDIKDLKEFYHLYRGNEMPYPISYSTADLFNFLEDAGSRFLSFIQQKLPEEIASKLSIPLSQMAADSPKTLFRVIHYPPLTGNEIAGSVRAAAHEDINLITLLPAATDTGLELLDRSGNWVAVPSNPGTLIINVGDMLQEATGGYLKSTTHRVVNPVENRSRYSMPLFLHPRQDVVLSERHTAESYLEERLKELGLK